MDEIINCMFLNPVWEKFHKSHRTTGTGMEKTKHMSQELVWSPHRKTRQKLKSLHSWSFPFHCITTACAYMQAVIQQEVSLCSLDARNRKTETPQVSLPRGLDPAPPQEAGSDPGTGSYIPPIDVVGLASLFVFLANWHSPAHAQATKFTSRPKPSGCIAMASAWSLLTCQAASGTLCTAVCQTRAGHP